MNPPPVAATRGLHVEAPCRVLREGHPLDLGALDRRDRRLGARRLLLRRGLRTPGRSQDRDDGECHEPEPCVRRAPSCRPPSSIRYRPPRRRSAITDPHGRRDSARRLSRCSTRRRRPSSPWASASSVHLELDCLRPRSRAAGASVPARTAGRARGRRTALADRRGDQPAEDHEAHRHDQLEPRDRSPITNAGTSIDHRSARPSSRSAPALPRGAGRQRPRPSSGPSSAEPLCSRLTTRHVGAQCDQQHRQQTRDGRERHRRRRRYEQRGCRR